MEQLASEANRKRREAERRAMSGAGADMADDGGGGLKEKRNDARIAKLEQENEELRKQLEERPAAGEGGGGDESAELAAANERVKQLTEQLVKNATEQVRDCRDSHSL